MKRLVDFFVKRWVLTLSVFGSLMLFGMISYVGIGIDLFPEIDTATVVVNTAYPGAGSQEVVQQVTEPIEDELNTIPGVSSIESSSLEGLSIITISFDADIDENDAAFEVNQRVNLVLNDLPDDATTPNIRKFDPSDQPIVNIAVSSPGADLQEVQDYVEDTLQPTLRRVDGVCRRLGGRPCRTRDSGIFRPDEVGAVRPEPQRCVHCRRGFGARLGVWDARVWQRGASP